MESFTLSPTPFSCDTGKGPGVCVSAGKEAYTLTREVLEHIDLSPAGGKRVLLKPNAGRIASAGEGITTNPDVVAAAIDTFTETGASVAVGESPITGVDTLEAFESSGIAAIARERNCPLIDMDARPFIPVSVPEGVAIDRIKVCAEIVEYDFIVSIPVMKTHMHTGVTLAVKNMKGCLWRRSKVDLHMLPQIEGRTEKPLDIAIADMSSVLAPQLAIIDGTVAMEGLGPSAGESIQLGVVLASPDAFAADAVACRLMGKAPEKIPHLREGAARGNGEIELDRISITPGNWQEWIRPFKDAPGNLSIEFPNTRVLDCNSCSACQSTLLLFLRRYGDKLLDYFPPELTPTLAIGKGHNEVPEGTVCVGICTKNLQNKGIHVAGCPPVASAIMKAITEANPGKNTGGDPQP